MWAPGGAPVGKGRAPPGLPGPLRAKGWHDERTASGTAPAGSGGGSRSRSLPAFPRSRSVNFRGSISARTAQSPAACDPIGNRVSGGPCAAGSYAAAVPTGNLRGEGFGRWMAALAVLIYAGAPALVIRRPGGLGTGWSALGWARRCAGGHRGFWTCRRWSGWGGTRRRGVVVSFAGRVRVLRVGRAARGALGRGRGQWLFVLVPLLGAVISEVLADDGAVLIRTPIVLVGASRFPPRSRAGHRFRRGCPGICCRGRYFRAVVVLTVPVLLVTLPALAGWLALLAR